jgi:hypothetical protein
MTTMTDQQIATMTPEQLAEHGIPAVVALRARLADLRQEENIHRHLTGTRGVVGVAIYGAAADAIEDALAILEAERER